MIARLATLAAVPVLLGADDPGAGVGKRSAAPVSFPVAAVHFEQNVTDSDIEAVFEVMGRDQGLAKLVVAAPDGHTVIDFTAPDASTMGIRQFRFESPEPGDVASLKAAYPEGVYTFTGATSAGEKLESQSRLSHRLPPPAAFLRPVANARGVGIVGLIVTWTAIKDVVAYVVYIEQPDLDFSLTARLPASVTRFAVPDGVLVPGRQYQLGIGTVMAQGNSSFVETTFTTAGKP
jgi:hypothetical protein